jgi:GrpB-like predicted nucleotidyltransferase (UPF0157 family)
MQEKVVIFPYDQKSQEEFSRLVTSLRFTLGNTAMRIDHIALSQFPSWMPNPWLA